MGRNKRNSIAVLNPHGGGLYAHPGPPHGRAVGFLPPLLRARFAAAGTRGACRCARARFL